MAEPVRPSTRADLIEVLRRTIPAEEVDRYFDAAELGADRPIVALAHQAATLADTIYERMQANYLRTHSTAGREPASGWRYAECVVTMRRTKDLHEPRYIVGAGSESEAASGDFRPYGAMILDGPGGRRYRNFGAQYFPENDNSEREVVFVCEVPGFIGNLDGYGDLLDLLTDEGDGDKPNRPAYLTHANLSADRANTGASIGASSDPSLPSRIVDSGIPDQFLPQHAGLYLEILDSDAPANIGRIVRVVSHESPLIENPPGSGLYPTTVFVDDLAAYKDAKAVRVDDGGVFTDYTAEAASNAPDDVPLFPAPATVGDAIYFGAAAEFDGIAVAVTTPSDGTFQLTWEYWNGGAWVSMMFGFDFADGLGQWSVQGEGQVTWATLTGWTPVAVDGVVAYWVRARVAAVTVVAQEPLAAKVQCLFNQRLTSGTCHWRILDWRDLGFEITSITVPAGGRDAILDMYAEERGARPRQSFEDDETMRDRIAELADVVTPGAILRAVNRALEPYGMEGLAIDAANGFDGLFIDVDALDYYEPGDLYPENPWKLYTTKSEAFGWFWVVAPCLGDGEWGTSYDDGPTIFLEPLSLFLGPAYDFGFFDGFATGANAVYASIYQTVDAIRGAGIGFTMLRSCDLNLKKC